MYGFVMSAILSASVQGTRRAMSGSVAGHAAGRRWSAVAGLGHRHYLDMNTRIIQLVLIATLEFRVAACAADFTWPDREAGLTWPKPRSAARILEDRFASASTNALGSPTDTIAVKAAIVLAKPQSQVEQIRWLSSDLVMVKVRLPESCWYYVVERKKDGWTILIYYLKWIS